MTLQVHSIHNTTVTPAHYLPYAGSGHTLGHGATNQSVTQTNHKQNDGVSVQDISIHDMAMNLLFKGLNQEQHLFAQVMWNQFIQRKAECVDKANGNVSFGKFFLLGALDSFYAPPEEIQIPEPANYQQPPKIPIINNHHDETQNHQVSNLYKQHMKSTIEKINNDQAFTFKIALIFNEMLKTQFGNSNLEKIQGIIRTHANLKKHGDLVKEAEKIGKAIVDEIIKNQISAINCLSGKDANIQSIKTLILSITNKC